MYSNFTILKIKNETQPLGVFYKVFVCDYSQEWRFNSGIVDYEFNEDFVWFYGYSGSIYWCDLEGVDSCNPYYTDLLNKFTQSELVSIITYEQFKEEFELWKQELKATTKQGTS